jgi:hypothetical protein
MPMHGPELVSRIINGYRTLDTQRASAGLAPLPIVVPNDMFDTLAGTYPHQVDHSECRMYLCFSAHYNYGDYRMFIYPESYATHHYCEAPCMRPNYNG